MRLDGIWLRFWIIITFIAATGWVIWVAITATSAATAVTSVNEIIIVELTAGKLVEVCPVPCTVVWITIDVEAGAISIIIEADFWLRIRRGFWVRIWSGLKLGIDDDSDRFLDVGQGIVLQIRQYSDLV